MPLSPRGAKRKGDDYEREVADHLNTALFNGTQRVLRAPLSGGGRSLTGAGNADLTGTPSLWVECKRTERFRPLEALRQAQRGAAAARSPDIPIVVSRPSHMSTGSSMVVLSLDDFIRLYRSFIAAAPS